MAARKGITVHITDKSAAKTVQSIFGKNDAHVKVGVFGDKGEQTHDGGGPTLADIAGWMEFGTETIEPRSFIGSYFDKATPELRALLVKLMQVELQKAIKSGQPITDANRTRILNIVGLKSVGEIQARIAAGEITPELKQSTIDRKGSSTPLIDSGQLRSGITYEVSLTGKATK